MTTKKVLLKAQQAKKDEYYTLWKDIAAEVSLYKSQLKGKKILCPCDWDESYNEELIYKEEGYVAPSNLLDNGGTIKNAFGRTQGAIRSKFFHFIFKSLSCT